MRLKDLCEFCWHQDELHDYTTDKRTPKAVGGGKFVCVDCASCELEWPVIVNA